MRISAGKLIIESAGTSTHPNERNVFDCGHSIDFVSKDFYHALEVVDRISLDSLRYKRDGTRTWKKALDYLRASYWKYVTFSAD